MTTLFENGEQESGMPWQVKAIGLIGIPGALAIYFAFTLNQDVRANQIRTNENLSLMATQVNRSNEQNNKLITTLEDLKRSIDRICANTARNFQERNECFR